MKLKTGFLVTSALFAASGAMAVEASFYGQVNKLAAHVDNGVKDVTSIVDNASSSTRFGFKAQQQLDSGLVVSALLELESKTNSSDTASFDDDEANAGLVAIKERHSRVGLGTKFGTFLIGNTSEATDGISEMDLGSVQDVMCSDITIIAGDVTFAHEDNSRSTTPIADGYSNMDGIRTNLVRFDSPIYNGVSTSASMTSGGDLSLAAKFTGYVAQNVKVKAGLGFKNHESSEYTTFENTFSGSVSAKHETSGLAATVAAGRRTYKTADTSASSFVYTKLSYAPITTNFEFAADYARAERAQSDEGHVRSYGVGTQYNIADGVSTSLMYRNVDGSDILSTQAIKDIDIVTAGLRVKF